MVLVNSRQTLIDFCLRKLGHPVIQINLDVDQIEDRVDEALQFFQDFHFDGVEKTYFKYQITDTDITNQYVTIPENIISVSRIFPFKRHGSSMGLFNIEYQWRLHDLMSFTATSYTN